MTRFALTVGLSLMDACWLAVWAVLLGRFADPQTGRPLLSAASIVALELGAAWSTEFLGRHALNWGRVRGGLIAIGLAAIVLVLFLEGYELQRTGVALLTALSGLTAPALAFILALGVWWRGILLGRQTSTSVEVESAFRWGIATLVLFGIVQLLTTRGAQLSDLQGGTTIFVVGFFFISLVTLALGRLESLTTRTRKVTLNSQWLTVLVAVSAGIVLAALVLGQLISFDLLVIATRPFFDLLGRILLVLVYIIVIPIAYIVELIIYALLSLLHPGENVQRPEPMQPSDFENMLQRLFGQGMPADVLAALKAAVVLVALGVALFLLNRAFRRWRPMARETEAAEEERESVFVAARLRDMLLAWLRGLFRRRGIAVEVATVETGLTGEEAPSGIGSVRELYRELLRRGETAGVRRGPATTPAEHEAPLSTALEPDNSVSTLTVAYEEARYAERQIDAAEALRLSEALDAVRARD